MALLQPLKSGTNPSETWNISKQDFICYLKALKYHKEENYVQTSPFLQIVLLLHTVVHSMGLYKEAIQLANLVVEEQHHLYKVYTKSQLGELLSKVRESSLASLAQSKDPWGHPVAS